MADHPFRRASDPPEADRFDEFGLEGTMPDDSLVRITVWSPGEKDLVTATAFNARVKQALVAAMTVMYDVCQRPR